MPFALTERRILLELKGVGPKVIERLEQLGIDDLDRLARQDAAVLCTAVAGLVGSTCWRNSPLARGAIERAILAAKATLGPPIRHPPTESDRSGRR
jgi:nucleotidyltransferase/DNA polymerase involved in DNA repair